MSEVAASLWIVVAICTFLFLLIATSLIVSCQRYESCMREIKKVEACGQP